MTRRLTIDEVRERASISHPTVVILEEEYIGCRENMKCHCLVCGREFSICWSSLNQGANCPHCAIKKNSDALRYTMTEVKNKIAEVNPTIEILSDEYHNNKTKLKCKCRICSHEFESILSVLNRGRGCPRCSAKKLGEDRMITLEQVKEKLAKISPEIKIISTEYRGNSKHLECFCEKCSTIFFASWSNLSQGKRCRNCQILRMSGEKSHLWKGGITAIGEYLRHQMRRWKKDSIKNCGGKCVISGEDHDDVHHLYGFDLILEETFDRTNIRKHVNISDYTKEELKQLKDVCLSIHREHELGVCLTEKNHDEFHKIYGYGKNTPEQFNEFLELKLQDKAS